MSLNGNPFTVNCSPPFANGSYAIISLAGGTIDTNATAFPPGTGTAIGPGHYGFISVDEVAGAVLLNITNAQAPFFVTQPAGGGTIFEGDTVTLSFDAGGTGPLSYQWLLNGVMIPGATNTILSFTNAQPSNSGSFSVNIQSPYGVTNSQPVIVRVENQDLFISDDFYSAPVFTDLNLVGLSQNSTATNEPGAPNNDGKNGAHAVWMVWQPPNSGIATFFTLGSAFDTVLAVYTNNAPAGAATLSSLTAVAADDDSGDYLTGSVQFNAVAGQSYYVAVDGFGPLAAGNIVLSWSLEVTSQPLPVIVQQPLCYVAAIGNTVSFSVQADGGTNSNGIPYPVSYHWMEDGVSIPGATNSSLTLSNVQPANVDHRGDRAAVAAAAPGTPAPTIAWSRAGRRGPPWRRLARERILLEGLLRRIHLLIDELAAHRMLCGQSADGFCSRQGLESQAFSLPRLHCLGRTTNTDPRMRVNRRSAIMTYHVCFLRKNWVTFH